MVYTSERWRASWYMNDIYIYNISMVYTWYIHGILHVYAVLIDMSGIYLVKTSWVCSVPFFIMIYLGYTMNISKDSTRSGLPRLRESLTQWP